MSVCMCVRACVRACVRVCVCVDEHRSTISAWTNIHSPTFTIAILFFNNFLFGVLFCLFTFHTTHIVYQIFTSSVMLCRV